MPPGASPRSPLVHVTTIVRTPCSAYIASTPPVLDDSSSGCACTAISVNGFAMPSSLPVRLTDGDWLVRQTRLTGSTEPRGDQNAVSQCCVVLVSLVRVRLGGHRSGRRCSAALLTSRATTVRYRVDGRRKGSAVRTRPWQARLMAETFRDCGSWHDVCHVPVLSAH